MNNQVSSIDLSRLTLPPVIEPLSFEDLRTQFVERFKDFWRDARQQDPSLPEYDVAMIQSDPAMIHAQVFSFIRLLDRARVNDGLKALFGFTATGDDLDHFVLCKNITRKIIEPAIDDKPAVYETDLQLLRRYLLAHDIKASGSSGRYLLDAYNAVPGLLDARVNGFEEHGRRGDCQLVVLGKNGTKVGDEDILKISRAVRHPDRMPDGVNIGIRSSNIRFYNVELSLTVSPTGPAQDVILNEAKKRIEKGTQSRMVINGEIPDGFIQSLGFGPNIIACRDNLNIVIESEPYTTPKMNNLNIILEVANGH